MAFTLFSTAIVAVVAAAGLTVLRMPPLMTCPHSFHYQVGNDYTNNFFDARNDVPNNSFKRYVIIGDIHGSSNGLREILDGAGVLEKEEGNEMHCKRSLSPLSMETVVIQLGDIVDRGRNASKAWDCLDELQQTSKKPGSVIRLVGNHEIDWIQGNYRGSKDTPEYRRLLTKRIRQDIMNQKIIGSLSLFNGRILLTHAGLRQEMYDYIMTSEKSNLLLNNNHNNVDVDLPSSTSPESQFLLHDETLEKEESIKTSVSKNDDDDGDIIPMATLIANFISNKLISAVNACPEKHSLITSSLYRPICPELRNPIFGAGPERGGQGIGGPFWTDFSVISKISSNDEVSKFIQIVGHSAANCDVLENPKCQPIRTTEYAIAADAAIYWGNRAYLELLVHDGDDAWVTFVSHTKQRNGLWLARNLTNGKKCGRPLIRQRDASNRLWAKAHRAIKGFMNR